MKYLITFAMLLLTACSGVQTIPDNQIPPARNPELLSQTPINAVEDVPEWVLKGAGAFIDDDEDKAFYGVGSATGVKNFSLARMMADDRARNDLAKMIAFDTRSLMKDYLGHTTAGDFTATSEEQHAEAAIKTLTNATVSGIVVVDHWEHPNRNELFSLAKLDLDKYKEMVDQYKELSKEMRAVVKERADKLHEELEAELERKRQIAKGESLAEKETLLERERELLEREKDAFNQIQNVEKTKKKLSKVVNENKEEAEEVLQPDTIEEMTLYEEPEPTDFERKWRNKPQIDTRNWFEKLF